MVLYLYLPSRYLNVAFHRHYDEREREGGREGGREGEREGGKEGGSEGVSK